MQPVNIGIGSVNGLVIPALRPLPAESQEREQNRQAVRMEYIELFILWEKKRQDYKDRLYWNITEDNKYAYWDIIEKKYLSRYRKLVRIGFEWSSTGIWRIPYPGSVSAETNKNYNFLRLPDSAIADLKAWHGLHGQFRSAGN